MSDQAPDDEFVPQHDRLDTHLLLSLVDGAVGVHAPLSYISSFLFGKLQGCANMAQRSSDRILEDYNLLLLESFEEGVRRSPARFFDGTDDKDEIARQHAHDLWSDHIIQDRDHHDAFERRQKQNQDILWHDVLGFLGLWAMARNLVCQLEKEFRKADQSLPDLKDIIDSNYLGNNNKQAPASSLGFYVRGRHIFEHINERVPGSEEKNATGGPFGTLDISIPGNGIQERYFDGNQIHNLFSLEYSLLTVGQETWDVGSVGVQKLTAFVSSVETIMREYALTRLRPT